MSETARAVRPAEIFETLRQRILRWEYAPGHRFTEEELCREFGVSRSPVREALRMLEEGGLVDRAPYRGCTVKQPHLREIDELYEVRLVLESAAVEQLARAGMAAERLAGLAAEWERLGRVAPDAQVDGAALAEQDRAFHEALVEAAGNRTLYDMLRVVNDRLHFVRMTDITTGERLLETCRQHVHILDRIAARDAAGAKDALVRNVAGARAHVESAVKDALARAYMLTYGRSH